MAAQTRSRPHQGLFRLAVDRVFTLAGHGTVVTGTMFSGQVRTGDTVAVMPAGLTARVRSLHAQNRAADLGRAGERCALNLAGVDKSAISRGDWLADPRALAPSTRIDVLLTLLADSGAQLTSWAPLHVHLGTTHRLAHVVPLQSPGPGGESARVQLVFDAPMCALPGDRLIVRDAQGRHTLGGGRVLDPCAPARRRRSVERLGFLAALERMLAGEGITPLLQQARFGVPISELVRLTGCPPERLPLPTAALTIAAGSEHWVLLPARWQALRASALSALVDELARERLVVLSGAWLHLPEHAVTLSASDQTLARKLQPLIAAGGFDPPWVRELAARVDEPEERVREVLRKQVTQGGVYQVVRDLFYDRERIAELAEIVGAATREHGGVNAARFRDTLGTGRKRAIQILEFFDRVGYTRRVRDAHVLRPDSAWRSTSGPATGPAAATPSGVSSAVSARR